MSDTITQAQPQATAAHEPIPTTPQAQVEAPVTPSAPVNDAPAIIEAETPVIHSVEDVLRDAEAEEAPPANDAKVEEPAKPDAPEPDPLDKPKHLMSRGEKRAAARAADKKRIADLEAANAAGLKRMEQLETRLKELQEVDPNAPDANYEETLAHNAAVKVAKTQAQAELDEAKAAQADVAQQADAAKQDAFSNDREAFLEAGEAIEHIKDFREVVTADDVAFTSDTAQAFMSGALSPELAYKLATDADELSRVNALTPGERLIELGRMDSQLAKPVAPTTTAAPEPITPVQGQAPTAEPDGSDYQAFRKSLGMDPNGPGYLQA